jgi:hypothetical protein
MKYLTQLFNAVLLKGDFPGQWKAAQVNLILKARKFPNVLISYRPLTLLSTLSGKLLLKGFLRILQNNKFIPNHQFGF